MNGEASSEVRISHLSWPEYRRRIDAGAPILLPVGALEQHGHHLPLGTDLLVVGAICEEVARGLGALVAPTLPYGYKSHTRTGGGDAFPGTTNMSAATFMTVVREILSECVRHGARRLLVVNGHYENEWFLREACHEVGREFGSDGALRVVLMNYWDVRDEGVTERLYGSSEPLMPELQHAAWLETSLALHLVPGAVAEDAYPEPEVASFRPYDVFPPDRQGLPPSGSLSPVGPASAEAGRGLFDHYVAGIIEVAKREFA